MTEQQQQKQQAIDLLESRYRGMENVCEGIDMRLRMYFEDLLEHSSARLDDPRDWHGLYELLGGAKFLRCLDTYNFNTKKVQTVIRLREGEWRQDGQGRWHHVCGGLKCPGTSGAQVYRWQPFQVFVLTSVFGFYDWVNTKVRAEDKAELQPTERIKDGYVWDYRRVCTDFTYFGPRKTDKTGLAAYIQFVFFFFEDDNSEIYCCANSSDQAKLLYSRTRQLIAQMDGGNRIRSTQTVTDWRQAYKSVHNSLIMPLTAGGRTKDGLYAQLCCADEYGSAPYTNGKSDMLSLVNVVQSSMGPRREPMTFTTTTAGTISAGPFIDKLDALHRTLERELTGGTSFEDDRRLCLCLEPDEWEREEQVILAKPTLRRKVNPMLGIIVQHSSYDSWIAEAAGDSTKMPELLAKYFNVYQTGKVTKWITGDQMKHLQREMRIDQCTADQGWVVFTGLDFSLGGDWSGPGWLAARRHPSGRGTEFFADCDVWISEEEYENSPLHPLYEQWIAQGWMHLSPGKTFQPELFVGRLDELIKKGVQFMYFGYDKYKSKVPITVLKSYMQSKLKIKDPEPYVQVVSQLNSEFNGPTEDLYNTMFAPVPFISFSNSPLWQFCFNNVMLETDNRENKRPVKANQSASCKIDPIQCLVMALDLYERYEGSQH